jgi:hypothetical protein
MPNVALQAIIGGTSAPLRGELQLLQREAARTGPAISAGLNAGGEGGVRAGAIRETLVLMREISRGNWTRVPGSFTLLLDRLGLLNKLFGSAAAASNVVSQALSSQAAAAGVAAVKAEKLAQVAFIEADALKAKAMASDAAALAAGKENYQAVFKAAASGLEGKALTEVTQKTREKTVALQEVFEKDQLAAIAANENAEACAAEALAARKAATEIRQKALASAEAAEAEAAGAASALGPIAIGLAALVLLGAVVYEKFWGMRKALEGFKMPAIEMPYVAKGARATDEIANAQRKVTDEIRNTVEAYHSAEAAAKRVGEATKEHYEHLRKMNSLEKDPAKRAAGELAIDRQEKNVELGNKYQEKLNLEIESRNKLAAAGKLSQTVMSEAEEKEHAKVLREKAEAGRKFLKDEEEGKGHAGKALAVMLGGWRTELPKVNASIAQGQTEAERAIQNEKDFQDKEQERKQKREEAARLAAEGKRSGARAAEIGQEIPDLQKQNAQALKDKREELAAELANAPHRQVHGHVSDLQKVGAYTTGAVDIAHRQLRVLEKIEANTGHLGNGGGHVEHEGRTVF